MIEIIPAILETDFEEIQRKLARVSGLVPWVQIDVCDGILVSSKTWPYGDTSFRELVSEAKGLPYWDKLNFEVDLMVEKPLSVLEDWIAVGASRIIMQVGGKDSIEEVRAALSGRAEFAIAVSIDDDLKNVDSSIQEGDTIQVMGISRVGFQHQQFDERAIELLKHFKQQFPNVILSLDGGVDLDTAPRIVEAGATRLTIGSALFSAIDIKERLEEFRHITNAIHH